MKFSEDINITFEEAVEVWDTSDEGRARQLFIDFDKKEVEVKPYDK